MSEPLLSKQPFKALAQAGLFFALPPYLIYAILRNSIPSLRVEPKWSFRTSLMVGIMHLQYSLTAATRDQLPEQLKAGKSGEYVRIPPPDEEVVVGVASSSFVKTKSQPGVWYPSAPPSETAQDEKILLHFPGGAFVIAVPSDFLGPVVSRDLPKAIGATRMLYAQYRLARDEASRFPGALLDAVTFYSHVLSLGVKPANIIVSGDSAGGTLALTLLRYLQTSGCGLPLPAAVLAWSPWVDIPADAGAAFTRARNSPKEILNAEVLQWGADAYRPRGELSDEVEAYVNPLHRPIETQIPLFLQAGGSEAFMDTVARFAEEQVKVNGKKSTRFHESPFGTHDMLASHHLVGMTGENEAAIAKLREYLAEVGVWVEQ
ncbi:unnamed protein product [Clonostachys rhizophaga]|uniref:Alpha/beta hydrolase fold-3 domain-containing protein n=1 Tax=Clonostachys rhizophaga TaxID=160324 RepID=A0A9N9VBN8_9HYPO|nr:unnamed protein product [Clonostachys rhizophaga]